MSAAWRLTGDPQQFAAQAGGFVEAQLDRNVIATVLADIVAGAFSTALMAHAVDRDGTTCAVAIRTPPWPLLVAGLDDERAESLLGVWLDADPDLPGVGGPAASARALAQSWSRATGGATQLAMRETMHSLDRVEPPARPAPGGLRVATLEDLELLTAWEAGFRLEAGVAISGEEERTVRRRLEREGQYIWIDERPVSTVARSRMVGRVVRIGPVYTPPELRGRGYASAAVAALSASALAAGAESCMLLTDVANPTSNKIYAALGYRRFADWEDHHFSLPS